MNPTHWKREHKVALLGAAALGTIAGLIFGLFILDAYELFRMGALSCDHDGYDCWRDLSGYWLRILGWGVLGGTGAGALVYIRQLLRA